MGRAVGERDFLRLGANQPRQEGPHSTRKGKVFLACQSVGMTLQLDGFANPLGSLQREGSLGGAVEESRLAEIGKILAVIIHDGSGLSNVDSLASFAESSASELSTLLRDFQNRGPTHARATASMAKWTIIEG